MSRLLAIVAVIAVISAVQPGRLFHTFMACQVSEQGTDRQVLRRVEGRRLIDVQATQSLVSENLSAFEDPSHPLYSDGSIKYDNELEQEISDYVDEEGLEALEDLIGPNYYRQMGDKPTEYRKWGCKYYRKSK